MDEGAQRFAFSCGAIITRRLQFIHREQVQFRVCSCVSPSFAPEQDLEYILIPIGEQDIEYILIPIGGGCALGNEISF